MHRSRILFVTLLLSSQLLQASDALPVIRSIEKTSESDIVKPFQFSDDLVIDLLGRMGKGEGTNASSTPLQIALNRDRTALLLLWRKHNEISFFSNLWHQAYLNFMFPQEQSTRILKCLLEKDKSLANEEYCYGDRPLHRAKHPKHIAILLKYGANPAAVNDVSETPLEKDLGLRQMDKIEAFLKAGVHMITDERFNSACIPSKEFTSGLNELLTQYKYPTVNYLQSAEYYSLEADF